MPDAKRKLPVLWIGIAEIDDAINDRCNLASTSKYLDTDIPYEPAVPRCRTCENWTQELDGRRCNLPGFLWVPGASENGFCHNHSDLKS